MAGLEVAAITLGTAVAKTVCELWLGDRKLVAGVAGGAIDYAAQRFTGARERRQFRRVWEQAAELVAERLEPLIAQEFRGLAEHEQVAAVDAVRHTFEVAALTEDDLFAQDLDAAYLARHLRGQDPDRVERVGLGEPGGKLYEIVLRECCAYTVEMARTLPVGPAALSEILRRERQILDDLRDVLQRLPARRAVADFERDYRQLVAHRLDQVELFGASLAETSRRYPLSVAYLSLTASATTRRPHRRTHRPEPTPDGALPPATVISRVEDVLAGTRRLFVRGQAGLGKTTLLHWIAVQSARGSFPLALEEWGGTVPFFVPLRRYATGALPAPGEFLTEIGRHIAEEMPDGWVHAQLRSGRAVLLVDGVDELPEDRRGEVREWLRELVVTFPTARYVITSRPAAAPEDWLGGADFDVAELEPMSRDDVAVFVHRWHQAVREQCPDDTERDRLADYERALLDALAARRHLRQLAGYPLLCALLCALHRDRRAQLPGNRMELYEVALHMLLERRDDERHITPAARLSRTEKMLLLRDLAYWLIRNGWTAAPADRVRDRIATKLAGMPQVDSPADDVYRTLLERSGLLRLPVEGQVDFVHRSFQEYLAAAEAVSLDDIGLLVDRAYTDLWSDVVVMAAGHAATAQRVELLRGLLARAGRRTRSQLRTTLRLLVVACLETSAELPPEVLAEVQEAASSVLPPRTMAAAEAFARAGGFALDLLTRVEPRHVRETAATVRAVARIGDPAGLSILARFGADERELVVRELVAAWPNFDPEAYARMVLRDSPLSASRPGHVQVRDPAVLPGLRHLTRLTAVTYVDDRPVDLSFVRPLPHLRQLHISGAAASDLAGLAGTGLHVFRTLVLAPPGDSVLDLGPVAELPEIVHFGAWGRRVTNLAALPRRLRGLELDNVAVDELGEIGGLNDLDTLELNRCDGLVDLEPLEFLNGAKRLEFWMCRDLRDLSGVTRWAATLTAVTLMSVPVADLTPLRDLPNLRHLMVDGDAADLSGLAGMSSLERLDLLRHRPRRLSVLNDLPAVTTLYLHGTQDIDLADVPDRSGLTVYVDREAVLHGVDRLSRTAVIRR